MNKKQKKIASRFARTGNYLLAFLTDETGDQLKRCVEIEMEIGLVF